MSWWYGKRGSEKIQGRLEPCGHQRSRAGQGEAPLTGPCVSDAFSLEQQLPQVTDRFFSDVFNLICLTVIEDKIYSMNCSNK